MTRVVQRTGTLPLSGDLCHTLRRQASSKTLSDLSRAQQLSKQATEPFWGQRVGAEGREGGMEGEE